MATKKNDESVKNDTSAKIFQTIRNVTAWTTIISTALFCLIGVLGIWEVFGENTGDVVWRAFTSLLIIGFSSFIINIAARIVLPKS